MIMIIAVWFISLYILLAWRLVLDCLCLWPSEGYVYVILLKPLEYKQFFNQGLILKPPFHLHSSAKRMPHHLFLASPTTLSHSVAPNQTPAKLDLNYIIATPYVTRVVRNFRSRRRLNRSRWRMVSLLTFINNEDMEGRWRGVWGCSPQKILWKYAFIWWSFSHTVVNISSILHVYFVWTNISLILQKSRRRKWPE